jgi:hypothetical protein
VIVFMSVRHALDSPRRAAYLGPPKIVDWRLLPARTRWHSGAEYVRQREHPPGRAAAAWHSRIQQK